MSRRGQHWVTQQLRRSLFELAHAPESELSDRPTIVGQPGDPIETSTESPKVIWNAASATERFGDQEQN